MTIWDVEERAIVDTVDVRSNNVEFNTTGDRLAVAQEDGATVRNVEDLSQATALSGHRGSVFSASFDTTGSTVATTSFDGTVRLWDAETGLPQLVLPGHDIVPAAAEFTADGTMLASAGGDGVARVWALDLDDLVAIAQDKLTRGLTEAECREYLLVDACPAR